MTIPDEPAFSALFRRESGRLIAYQPAVMQAVYLMFDAGYHAAVAPEVVRLDVAGPQRANDRRCDR